MIFIARNIHKCIQKYLFTLGISVDIQINIVCICIWVLGRLGAFVLTIFKYLTLVFTSSVLLSLHEVCVCVVVGMHDNYTSGKTYMDIQ